MVFGQSNDPWEFLRNANLVSPENRPLYGIGEFLGLGINIILGTAFAVSMIAIIMAGIKIVTSKGDPKAKGEAQQALTYSVAALLLAIGAFTLKAVLLGTIGGNFGDLFNVTPDF